MICNKCNQQSPEGSIICMHCGAPLEAASSSHTTPQENVDNTTSAKNTKKFCTKCGSVIDSKTDLCPICTKNINDRPLPPTKPKTGKFIVFIIILSVLTFILLLLNVAQFFLNSASTSSNASAFQSEISNYEDIINERDETIDMQLDEISDLEAEIEELEADNEKLSFYQEHVVVIADDGTNLYHKYGCDDFDDTSFWAFNSEYAISEGYEPCDKCN